MSETMGLSQYLTETYPEYDSEQIIVENAEAISKAGVFFNVLSEVYEDREKYNIHWAYKQASESFDQVSDEISNHAKFNTNQNDVTAEMGVVIDKEIRKASKRYSLLSRLTLFLDIFISVALIVAVTLLAQVVERSLESVLYSIFFIGFIALVKVSLDRFLIIPRIDQWGWKRYWQLTSYVTTKLKQMMATKLVLKTALINQETQIKIMELMSRSEDIFYSRRPSSLNTRRNYVPLDLLTNDYDSFVSTISLED